MNKKLFLSTFIPGLSALTNNLLKKNLTDYRVIHCFDGAIVYLTESNIEKIKGLAFLNNTFLVIDTFECKQEKTFESIIRSIVSKKPNIDLKKYFKKNNFKIFFSNENEFTKVVRNKKEELEKYICKFYNLKIERSSQDFNEFWLLKRRENFYFFLYRITNEKAKLEKGELKKELTYIMNYLSEPSSNDIFLDPFSGSGAIPLMRTNFPYKYITIIDNNKDCIKSIKAKTSKKDKISVLLKDFYTVSFEDNFNKIVTDPPWGIYQTNINIEEFYYLFFKKVSEILMSKGILILLTSRNIEVVPLLEQFKDFFVCSKKYDILLSGKKASIYKIIKN